jgi:ferredoxin
MEKDMVVKKVVIDKNKCLGCGTCMALAGGTFAIGAEGVVDVIEPIGNSEEEIQMAIDACPNQAIAWKEE